MSHWVNYSLIVSNTLIPHLANASSVSVALNERCRASVLKRVSKLPVDTILGIGNERHTEMDFSEALTGYFSEIPNREFSEGSVHHEEERHHDGWHCIARIRHSCVCDEGTRSSRKACLPKDGVQVRDTAARQAHPE